MNLSSSGVKGGYPGLSYIRCGRSIGQGFMLGQVSCLRVLTGISLPVTFDSFLHRIRAVKCCPVVHIENRAFGRLWGRLKRVRNEPKNRLK